MIRKQLEKTDLIKWKKLKKLCKKRGIFFKTSKFDQGIFTTWFFCKSFEGSGEVSSSAKSLGGHSSPILHPNVEELIHEVKVKMETNSHFKGLKNPPKSEIHDFKIQKDRDSLLMKLLEEQRKLRLR